MSDDMIIFHKNTLHQFLLNFIDFIHTQGNKILTIILSTINLLSFTLLKFSYILFFLMDYLAPNSQNKERINSNLEERCNILSHSNRNKK